MLIRDGKDSTEHARALRAEKVAGAVLIAGLIFCLAGTLIMSRLHDAWIIIAEGVALAAFGIFLYASVNKHYAASRGEVKAAAVRRPADVAPKVI